MSRISIHLRGIALLSAGALGVHQLRFVAACGSRAEDVCGSPGHEYLVFAGPLAGMLLAVALGALLGELLKPGRGPAIRLSFRGRWLACAGALAAVYTAQELVEALVSPGRAIGAAAVVGNGGWWAFAFAVAIGALVALLLKGAEAAVAWARSVRRLRLAPPRPLASLIAHVVPSGPAVAFHTSPLGARAPPAPLV